MRIPLHRKTDPQDSIDPEVLKRRLYLVCCRYEEKEDSDYDEKYIIPACIQLWQVFKKYDFSLDRFMNDAAYEQIDNQELTLKILMYECIIETNRPIARYMMDWITGYLDFFQLVPGADPKWFKMSQLQLLHCFYNCNSDYEIWEFLAEGVSDMKKLYRWYMGQNPSPIFSEIIRKPCFFEKDEHKAEELLNFILNPSTFAIDSVRKKAEMLKQETGCKE